MKRFVVSAPRSGLNWVRYCTEHFYGLRTPGKPLLIGKEDQPETAFVRSHDALFTQKKPTGAWKEILPERVKGGKLALILRDPLEAFVRTANGKIRHFGLYTGNIRLYGLTAPEDRAVFYYDDITVEPKTMLALFEHLQLEPAPDFEKPDLASISEQWKTVSNASRGIYDINQSAGGGAMTKENPTDFKFHQRSLSDREKAKVWRYLKRVLTDEEFALLARYAPEREIKPQSYIQMVTDYLS